MRQIAGKNPIAAVHSLFQDLQKLKYKKSRARSYCYNSTA